ncbi:hypothetical protein R3W88_016362 [Solanum pinnatisectum]|uniref:Ribosomal protein S11 n=1 Tax=Solanum pinnatisectum TaxID=50273 RepID=A0AAV9KZL2_9SOLN|nr:hypothetical protein R3W88_016362 [Solanum pinnatisectum]
MAKAIPKISSRRNGRISSRKGARRIPKGVIHVQASFNNTIVIICMYGSSSFLVLTAFPDSKVREEEHRFAAQTAARNAIR